MLLYTKALERRGREADRLAIAVSRGIAITYDRDARRAFERARARRDPKPRQTAAQFTATLGRLAAIPGMDVRLN